MDQRDQLAPPAAVLADEHVAPEHPSHPDGDGDVDLDALVGNGKQDRLVLNLARQLAWRGVPRQASRW